MPDEKPIPAATNHEAIELTIIYLLTDPDDNQPLWALEDLARELDEPEAIIYIRRLQEAGILDTAPQTAMSSQAVQPCARFSSSATMSAEGRAEGVSD